MLCDDDDINDGSSCSAKACMIYLSTYLSVCLSMEQMVSVRTVEEHQLSTHMPPPVAVKDGSSKALVSPMPGTLVSCTAFVGQAVEVMMNQHHP